MGSPQPAFNLKVGKGGFPYQDVMCHRLSRRKYANGYSMPSARGSHSEISGT